MNLADDLLFRLHIDCHVYCGKGAAPEDGVFDEELVAELLSIGVSGRTFFFWKKFKTYQGFLLLARGQGKFGVRNGVVTKSKRARPDGNDVVVL